VNQRLITQSLLLEDSAYAQTLELRQNSFEKITINRFAIFIQMDPIKGQILSQLIAFIERVQSIGDYWSSAT
jgi:hypothetical protein